MTHRPHGSTKSKLFPTYSSVAYSLHTPHSEFSPVTMKPGWALRGRPSFPSELLKESLCHHSVKSNPIASTLTAPPLPAPTRPNPCLLRAPCNWTPLCQTNLVPISDTPRRRRSSRRLRHTTAQPVLPNEPNIVGNPSKRNRYRPLDEPNSTSGEPPGGWAVTQEFQSFRKSSAASAKPGYGARDFRVSKLRRSSPSISTGVSEMKTLRRNFGFARRRRKGSAPMWPWPILAWRSTREPSGALESLA